MKRRPQKIGDTAPFGRSDPLTDRGAEPLNVLGIGAAHAAHLKLRLRSSREMGGLHVQRGERKLSTPVRYEWKDAGMLVTSELSSAPCIFS